MKMINKLTFLLSFLVLFFSACEETEFEKTSESIGNTVAFTQSAVSIDENAVVTSADGETFFANNTYEVKVVRSSVDLSSPLTVQLNLSGKFLSDSDFANQGDDASSNFQVSKDISSLTIPAGEVSVSFYITTLNNTLSTGDIGISLSITGVSDGSYKIGENISQIRKDMSITIVDDDCPFNVDKLTGTFSVKQYDLHGGPTLEGEYEVEITQDPGNPLVLLVDGLVSELYGTVTDMVVPLTLVTCKKAALYPSGQQVGVYGGSAPVAITRRDAYFGGEPGPVFSVQNGIEFEEDSDWVSYNDEAGTITIYGWLEVLGLGSFGGKSWELTKVE